jgi:L-threonylcarbamoyladenylate synthase
MKAARSSKKAFFSNTLHLSTHRGVRSRNIRRAARLLRKGELVAFPTETVYGLGANVFDPRAVRSIFKAKGRPEDNPLIVHVHSLHQVQFLAASLPLMFWVLADKFMPGPLTVVLKKSSAVPDVVTAGLPTVAVRFPDHPVAKALLKETGVPLVAPSANLSGRPSPTRAVHVREDLNRRIAAILDGGNCRIGLESTVLDLTRRVPVILRPGRVTREDIENALGIRIRVHRGSAGRPASPGMKYKHYAPHAEMILFEGEKRRISVAMRSFINSMKGKRKVGVLATENSSRRFEDTAFVSLGRTGASEAARRLFAGLREMDKRRVDVILCEGFPMQSIGSALMNRLRKAATRRIRV